MILVFPVSRVWLPVAYFILFISWQIAWQPFVQLEMAILLEQVMTNLWDSGLWSPIIWDTFLSDPRVSAANTFTVGYLSKAPLNVRSSRNWRLSSAPWLIQIIEPHLTVDMLPKNTRLPEYINNNDSSKWFKLNTYWYQLINIESQTMFISSQYVLAISCVHHILCAYIQNWHVFTTFHACSPNIPQSHFPGPQDCCTLACHNDPM